MIEITVVNKETGQVTTTKTGRFAIMAIGEEEGSRAVIVGDTNLVEIAQVAGDSMRTILHEISKNDANPDDCETLLHTFFMNHFYNEKCTTQWYKETFQAQS